MKSVLTMLAVGFVLFEFAEHVILPLIWFVKDRKKKSVCGPMVMLGKVGIIKHWQGSEGQVFVHGELWKAVSEFPLSEGDRAVIENVDGLTLTVIPCKDGGTRKYHKSPDSRCFRKGGCLGEIAETPLLSSKSVGRLRQSRIPGRSRHEH